MELDDTIKETQAKMRRTSGQDRKLRSPVSKKQERVVKIKTHHVEITVVMERKT